MVINVVFLFCFSRHVEKDLKHWEKKRLYCSFSKWISFSECGHRDHIFKLQLTLDGLRMALKGQKMNWQKERSCVMKLYCRSVGFLEEEHS